MALKKTTQTSFGIEVIDAYHRVENVALISKTQISFQVRIRVDSSKSIFDEANYTGAYDITGDNPIAQAYAHLKTLPEYTDAIDC